MKSSYAKKLSAKEHTIKVEVADGSVETNFTIKTTNNPQTGDNLGAFISLLGISFIGLISLGIYLKKLKNN